MDSLLQIAGTFTRTHLDALLEDDAVMDETTRKMIESGDLEEKRTFTPRPWVLARSGNGLEIQVDTGTPGAGYMVCRITGSGPSDWANARLIEAAPDLYAALEDCLTLLQHGFDDDGAPIGTVAARRTRIGTLAAKTAARNALAKARNS